MVAFIRPISKYYLRMDGKKDSLADKTAAISG